MNNEAVETELLPCGCRIGTREYWNKHRICTPADQHPVAIAPESTSADYIRGLALEDAAKGCEDLVTFAPEHEQYVPADPNANCGWCDGLEEAAKRIRALIPNNEAEEGQ